MAVDIRDLGAHDLDAIAELERATNPQPWTRRMFEEELSLPPANRRWLVAESSSPRQLLGFAGMMFTTDAAHLMLVAVDPGATRRGIATQLCLALFDDARHRRVGGVTLEVRNSNHAAVALYERLGMTMKGTRPRYYPDGEGALLFWIDDLADPVIETRHRSLRAQVDRQGELDSRGDVEPEGAS